MVADESSVGSRIESQLPTATVTLELLFGFRLCRCASAVWTGHRANLSHNVKFLPFLLPSHYQDVGLTSCQWGTTYPRNSLLHAFLLPRFIEGLTK